MFDQLFEQLIQLAIRIRGYNPIGVAVELVLIWATVYLIWRFLKGTRGARVLRGVGLVVVAALLLIAVLGTERLGLERLRFLLENFVGFAALALVVVFQPELRRALMRLGEARLFQGRTVEMGGVIEEVARAVTYLSKNKIGAIIAIERSVGLKGIVEAGTALNADVSSELLKTIFWPGTALHDMGVVISDGKVVAAGVQFPLAEGDDIGQELGSRHRAAVGLSQDADCLVIVVSEETGAISLAERGQLLRKLSPDGLRAMLRRAMAPPDQKKAAARRAGTGERAGEGATGAASGGSGTRGGRGRAEKVDREKQDEPAAMSS